MGNGRNVEKRRLGRTTKPTWFQNQKSDPWMPSIQRKRHQFQTSPKHIKTECVSEKIRHNDMVIHNIMRKLHVIYQTMSNPLPFFRFRLERVTVVPKNTSSSMRGNAFAVADDVEEASRPVHSQVVHLLGKLHLDQSYLHSPKRRLSNGEKLGPPLSNAAGPNP